jgi:hypothetical protein
VGGAGLLDFGVAVEGFYFVMFFESICGGV